MSESAVYKKELLACITATMVLYANVVSAAPGFQVDVNVTDALLKDRHSKVWKQNPSAVNELYKYMIVGRRPDGAVMVLYQQPSSMNPKKIFVSGDFFKCGVKQDWPIFEVDGANDVNNLLKKPLLDDASNISMPISEGADVAVVYHAVCGK